MKKPGLLLAFAVAALLVGRPGVASADVAPARKPSPAAAKVDARLRKAGVPAAQSAEQVAKLTAAETAFFAADESRVQVVGGLTWYQWLSGLGWLLAIAAAAALLADHSNL